MPGVTVNPFTGKLQFIANNQVKRAGDTMTGSLILSTHPADGLNVLQSATKEYVDTLSDFVDKDLSVDIRSSLLNTVTISGIVNTASYDSENLIDGVTKTDSTNTRTVTITRNSNDIITAVEVAIT